MQITQADSLYNKRLDEFFQPNQVRQNRNKEYGTLIQKATQREGLRFAERVSFCKKSWGHLIFLKGCLTLLRLLLYVYNIYLICNGQRLKTGVHTKVTKRKRR